MSAYDDGIAVLTGRSSGVGLLPGFSTPDGALDHMNEVARAFDVLELDMRAAAARLPKNTLAAYEALKDEWRPWYAENKDWWPRFLAPGEIDDRAGVFAQKIIAFRELLQKKGEEVSGPPPTKPAPPVLDRVTAAAAGAVGSSSTYLKAGVVIAGIFAVGYGVKQIRSVLP